MKPVIIIAIAVVLLIPVSAYAIDYRDSTGYTPSWAIGQGYHYVLNQCNNLIGDYSSDGNWCFEWTAYVLDQGIENFPESTKSSSSSTSTSNLSERICTENKICVFPGEFLKYKNWDTYDNFEEIAVMEFKEKVNEDNIKFFADGFGSKPLTYNLNLKTGMETHFQYDTNRPFNFIEPIPMKIGQSVYRIIGDFYESTIAGEGTANLKEMGLMDMERTFMAAQVDYGGGDVGILGYDKETGVLVTQIEKYHLDGKEYTAGIVLIDTNIFSVPTKISSSIVTSIQNNEKVSTTVTKSNKIVSGEYLENISIKTENNDYTITAKIGKKPLQVNSIRITAENECPFKKQIFQKDLQYRSGTEVSFSFYQLSQSKPSECSIHFTLSTFDGYVLETIDVKYYLSIPEIKNKNPIQTKVTPQIISDIISDNVESKKSIPEWIKNNAKWWAEGQIGDSEFTNGIQHLLAEKIIDIPDLSDQVSEKSQEGIPNWIKNNAGWWADGKISEDDFINGIKYLVAQGIIRV